MSKVIYIRLKKAGARTGPFDIFTAYGDVIATGVSRVDLIKGLSYVVDDNVDFVKIRSVGQCFMKCTGEVTIKASTIYKYELMDWKFSNFDTASTWRHLTNPEIYNYFYDNINPYIVEYPFAYRYQDEILQNVKDYTKAYKYLPSVNGVWDDNRKVETDDRWFNKAILYNGQQSSGVLELVAKPKNNLSEYMKYPIYGTESKTITYTKSDNFYQYNTFWSMVKNKSIPLFTTECCYGLSLDKSVNQSNMDYGKRSFKKEPLRAKELKVRHILDNRYDAHLTSQFIVAPSQISYK
jgi:hypothetical protein